MPRRRWVVVAVAVLVTAAVTTAHARTTSLSARRLFAMSSATSALPTTLVLDNFNSTSSSLAGRQAQTGQSWIAARGTLQTNGALFCSTCNNDYAAAVIDADIATVGAASVTVTLGATGLAGLVMNSNVGASTAFAVLYGSSSVQVVRYQSGAASFVGNYPTGNVGTGTKVLSCSYAGGKYTITFAGQTFVYPVPTADQNLIAGNTYFGVAVYNDPGQTNKLDAFTVTK